MLTPKSLVETVVVIAAATATAAAVLFALGDPRHYVVDAQEHGGGLHSRLDCLDFDFERLPNAELRHVRELARVSVHAPGRVLLAGMLRAKCSEHADHAPTTVFRESSRDDLERLADRPVRHLRDALHALGVLREPLANGHLNCAATGYEPGVQDDVARDAHCVEQVALDFVQNILGAAAQHDRARLWRRAVDNVREILIADLAHLEKPSFGADVRLFQIFRTIDNSRTSSARDAIIIRLAQPADAGHFCFLKQVQSQIRDAFLGDNQVRLDSQHFAD
mmetsp:Transcript_15100/g.40496  ORF Transcript_15100/g.40496 Transcript_15100/m.40496 type:complete len:278 (+) Transcript_15100:132-965(+)